MQIQHIVFCLVLALAAEAHAATQPAPTPAAAGTAGVSAAATGPVRKLSLEDCIQMALEHNLNLQIQRLNPDMARYAVNLAYAGWDPNFNVTGNHYFQTTPASIDRSTRLLLPPGTVDANAYNTTLGGLTPVGLNYNISANISESYGQRNSVPFDSTSGGATLTLTQPLLKNFWIDTTRMNIQVTKKALRQSELGVRWQIMNVVASIEQAYYAVIAARENIAAQKKAMEMAERLLVENKERVRVGAMAPLDEKQAESQVAASRANVQAAQQNLDLQENNLKGLLYDNFSSWQSTDIQPTESLTAVPQAFSVQDSWSKGLTMRPDLNQVRLDVEKQNIVLKYNKNQLFPELDLVGSYGHVGANGIMRDFGGVLGQVENGSNPTYSYGATLTFPLTRTAARANYKTAKAQKQQFVLTLKQLEQTIMVQIDNAIKQAQASYERVNSTKDARLYAEAALDAEQKKLQSGKSTSFIVLQLQSNLTAARSSEIQALTDYNTALSQLALAEGFTLERERLNVQVK